MRVLIADDDPVSRRLLEATLSNSGYDIMMAVDGTQALRALEDKNCPRLVILDWIMPHMDGVEICRTVRSRSLEPYLYIIMLTVKGQQNEIVEGLEAGADDYITKPFDLLELKARLRAGRRILELQDQLIASRERLRFEASHDAQTGLLNHTAILELLRKEIIRSRRGGTALSVIMIDLDHFKSVNDQYGHLFGDTVLREVSRRLLGAIRPYDAVGRYGGEEFVAVAPGCTLQNAEQLAQRLRGAIGSEPIGDSAVSISITASLGVTTALGSESESDVLKASDDALYAAKIQGRNRVVIRGNSGSVLLDA